MAELLTFENLGNLVMLCFLQAVLEKNRMYEVLGQIA